MNSSKEKHYEKVIELLMSDINDQKTLIEKYKNLNNELSVTVLKKIESNL